MADWRTDDRELLARILMAEAGNQGPVGMTAVGNVIMNRANATGYGGGIRGVIMKPGQFSPMNSVTGYARGEQGQNIDSLRPSETHYMVADTLLAGNAGDITGGATHFFNPDISNPAWAEGKETRRIGDHVFLSADAGRGGPQAMTTTQGASPMMQEEQQPRGLLGSLGIQKMQEGAAGEDGQRFYERDTFKDTAAALAQGFAAMGSSPALQQMTADIAGQRSEAKARNKTVEYLRANGRGDLADMIAQGMISGKDAAGIMLAKPEDNRTALMQNYEYFIAQGMTPEQAMAAVKTGNTTNVNTGGDGKFEAAFATSDADTLAAVSSAGMQAMRNAGRIDELDRLLQAAPSGAEGYLKGVAGQYGVNTEGLSDIQAATALINSLVPEQRQPGSGPMSDADLELFKQSLPRIINQPGGNSQIISTMRAIADYDAQGAEIVQKLRAGEIDRPSAFKMLQSRTNPLSTFKPPAAGAPALSPVGDINSILGD